MLATVNDNSPKAINTSLFSLQQQIDLLQKDKEALMKQIIDLSNRISKIEEITNTV